MSTRVGMNKRGIKMTSHIMFRGDDSELEE
jgi:hypothetical protein